jgi:XTP/dITP diphosphohydrolase
MLDIVLASSNPGKMAEIKKLLADFPINLIAQSEFDIPDIEETGLTFIENAILKARHASKISGLPALADDSGLTIDALDDRPGVFSARYAGENATDQDRIQKVLAEMNDPDLERNACFHCVICLIEHANDPAPLICHGMWEGEIMLEPKGEHGFGYDPIFRVPTHGMSAAELAPDVKNQISHRGQAMQQLREVLNDLLQEN